MREILIRYSNDPSRYSVIHADLHPGNILVTGNTLTIDFDDTAWGWHMYDPAPARISGRALVRAGRRIAGLIEVYLS